MERAPWPGGLSPVMSSPAWERHGAPVAGEASSEVAPDPGCPASENRPSRTKLSKKLGSDPRRLGPALGTTWDNDPGRLRVAQEWWRGDCHARR